jgi:hypothetical protein
MRDRYTLHIGDGSDPGDSRLKIMLTARRILHFIVLFMVLGIVVTLWNHHADPNRAAVALEVAEEIDALVGFALMALMLEGVYRWRLRRRQAQSSEGD